MFYDHNKPKPKPTNLISKDEVLQLPASIAKVKRKPNQKKSANAETTGKRPSGKSETGRGRGSKSNEKPGKKSGRGRGRSKDFSNEEDDPLNFPLHSPFEDSDNSDNDLAMRQTQKTKTQATLQKSKSEETDPEERFLKGPRSTRSRNVTTPKRFKDTPERLKKQKPEAIPKRKTKKDTDFDVSFDSLDDYFKQVRKPLSSTYIMHVLKYVLQFA